MSSSSKWGLAALAAIFVLPVLAVLGFVLVGGGAAAALPPTPTCSADPSGTSCPVVNMQGWGKPIVGAQITSPFGLRLHPILGVYVLHAGVDLAEKCGTPIYAAHAGVVIADGGAGVTSQADEILVDEGDGTQTAYLHMYPTGIFVAPGDAVVAGQQIGTVGSAGLSTGCHLHFETHVNGSPVDPVPFMAARGVSLP